MWEIEKNRERHPAHIVKRVRPSASVRDNGMSISRYLTDGEWDGCFYLWQSQTHHSFSQVADKFINYLVQKNHVFQGLTEKGQPLKELHTTNADKIKFIKREPLYDDGRVDIIESGRHFIKITCPELLMETDTEFEQKVSEARDARPPKKKKRK